MIAGAGNTTITQHYLFTDGEVAAGWYYYRLEQVNISGGVTCSDIIALEVKATGISDSKGYNNPPPVIVYSASPALVSIKYHDTNPSWDGMLLLDLAGHRLGGLNKEKAETGGYTIQLAQSLLPGIYILRFWRPDKQELYKLLIAE
jgi:hypothetical protein